MGIIQGFLSLTGRVALVAIFLFALRNHISQFEGINQALLVRKLPAPAVTHGIAIGFMVLGSVSIILGYKARIGALMLFLFLGLSSMYFHNFWRIENAIEAEQQLIHFMKNVALMGAMLFIIANGPGAWSLDRCCAKAETPR